jgi:hypothetical protein
VEREQKRLRTLPTISSVVPMVHRTTTATTATHDDDKLAVVNEHTPLVIHGNHVTETDIDVDDDDDHHRNTFSATYV